MEKYFFKVSDLNQTKVYALQCKITTLTIVILQTLTFILTFCCFILTPIPKLPHLITIRVFRSEQRLRLFFVIVNFVFVLLYSQQAAIYLIKKKLCNKSYFVKHFLILMVEKTLVLIFSLKQSFIFNCSSFTEGFPKIVYDRYSRGYDQQSRVAKEPHGVMRS